MSEVDDEGLLERARRGDEEAFSRLFARHQRAVYRYAVYMCGPDAGDDIVQETFLVVLRQTARQDTLRGPVAGYLLGIARHLALKRLGSRGQDESLSDTLVSDSPAVIDDLTRSETIEAVRAAVPVRWPVSSALRPRLTRRRLIFSATTRQSGRS
jgi:DNA-directed RNA polymerase specialized sigma24 family protein